MGKEKGADILAPSCFATQKTRERLVFCDTLVVSHYQVTVDLLYQIQTDTDDDQQTGTSEETCHDVINLHAQGDECWQNGDQRKERGANQRNAGHYFFEILFSSLAGTIPRNKAALISKVVGNFLRVERDCHPEEGETEDTNYVEQVVEIGTVIL